MAEKWQIKIILGAFPGILGGLKFPSSLHSSTGKLHSVIIVKPVWDWGHSELPLKLNCKFLLPKMAENGKLSLTLVFYDLNWHCGKNSTLLIFCALALAIMRLDNFPAALRFRSF